MKLAFITDGGAKIGMGHIMRCLSLGKAFLSFGHEVVFLTKYKDGYETINQNGFKVLLLEEYKAVDDTTVGFNYGNYENLDTGSDMISKVLRELSVEVLIVDTYNVNEIYLNGLKSRVDTLIYIDDINAFNYPVDVILNGNITGEYMGYELHFQGEKLLIGPKYNLIRDEFNSLGKRKLAKDVHKIMITTGGSDPFKTTEKLIEIIRAESDMDNIELNIVVGNSFNDIKSLEKKADLYKNIVLHRNVARISDIMLNCDIAISSCGSTLYELCACGTPILGFIMAENQEFIAKKMSDEGYIDLLGWYNGITSEKLSKSLKALIMDYKKRMEMSKNQQMLVDGRGAERVVKEVEKIFNER